MSFLMLLRDIVAPESEPYRYPEPADDSEQARDPND